MVTQGEIFWLAGFLDAKGGFGLQRQRAKDSVYLYPHIKVSTTREGQARQISILLHDRLQIAGPYWWKTCNLTQKKEVYCITVSGPRAVGWMLTLYPLLSYCWQEKIKEIIAAWRSPI